MPPFTNSFFLFFVLWHINWFTSVQFCNCRNKVKFSVKTFLQWMGDRDVSGTARRRLFFVYCVVFVKLFLNGSALRMTFAHSVWTLALLDGDRRTWWWWWWWWCRRNWGEFLWIWGTGNDFFFFLQRVECKSLPGLKRTFGPVLICFLNTLIFRLNHFCFT